MDSWRANLGTIIEKTADHDATTGGKERQVSISEAKEAALSQFKIPTPDAIPGVGAKSIYAYFELTKQKPPSILRLETDQELSHSNRPVALLRPDLADRVRSL